MPENVLIKVYKVVEVTHAMFSVLQRSVMEDPKCMPPNMHPYILAMTGHNYNTYHYNRHNIPSVPAE